MDFYKYPTPNYSSCFEPVFTLCVDSYDECEQFIFTDTELSTHVKQASDLNDDDDKAGQRKLRKRNRIRTIQSDDSSAEASGDEYGVSFIL